MLHWTPREEHTFLQLQLLLNAETSDAERQSARLMLDAARQYRTLPSELNPQNAHVCNCHTAGSYIVPPYSQAQGILHACLDYQVRVRQQDCTLCRSTLFEVHSQSS